MILENSDQVKKEIIIPENCSNLEKILFNRDIIKSYVKKPIQFDEPILLLNGKPLIFPGTISTLQGRSGVHKSRLSEHISSVLIRKNGYETDLLSLSMNGKNDIMVLYCDTERNFKNQYPYSLQTILRNAGYDITDEPSNFDYISLIDISRDNRLPVFREYLERIRKNFKGHIFCIIDVATDLIGNFNDPKESLNFCDLLNQFINSFDVSFLVIVHENPGAEKMRGHLGSELMNKSSTCISIGYESNDKKPSEILKIQFLKTRQTKRIEPVHVKFDEERKKLVYANKIEVETAIHDKEVKGNLFEVCEFIIETFGINPFKRKDLITLMVQKFEITDRTCQDRIKDLVSGTVINSLGYAMVKRTEGKEVIYELKPYKISKQENLAI